MLTDLCVYMWYEACWQHERKGDAYALEWPKGFLHLVRARHDMNVWLEKSSNEYIISRFQRHTHTHKHIDSEYISSQSKYVDLAQQRPHTPNQINICKHLTLKSLRVLIYWRCQTIYFACSAFKGNFQRRFFNIQTVLFFRETFWPIAFFICFASNADNVLRTFKLI